MTKTRGKRGYVALLLALAMIVTSFTTGWATKESYGETGGSITATISVQGGGGYFYAPQKLTVEPGYAETVDESFANAEPAKGKVSVLDVICALHYKEFGEDFIADPKTYLSVSSSGFISTAFGTDAVGSAFAVNDKMPNDGVISGNQYTGYAATQAEVKEGDVIGYFFYQDTDMYLDYQTWFESNGAKTSEVTVNVSEKINLNLKGYSYMYDGCNPNLESRIKDIVDAQIVTIDSDNNFTDIENAVTDDDGNVSLSFDTAGTYYIGAYTDVEYDSPIVSPWLKVVVKGEAGYLSGLTFASSSSGTPYEMSPSFDADTHQYTVTVPDDQSSCYVKATLSEAGGENAISIDYTNTSSTAKTVALTSGKGTSLSMLYTKGGKGTQATIKVGTQEYKVNFVRSRSLSSLSVYEGEKKLSLNKAFDAVSKEYTAKALEDVEKVTVDAVPVGSDYTVTYNGSPNKEVALNKTGDTAIKIKITATDDTSQEYTLTIKKVKAAKISIIVNSGNIVDANISVADQAGNKIDADTNKMYNLVPGEQVTYTVAKKGYTGASGSFAAEDKTINVTLLKTGHDLYEDIGAEWKNFRNSDGNMAIENTYTPIDGTKTVLKWSKSFGTSWTSTPSNQIIVGGNIISMYGNKIYKLDKKTGEVVGEGALAGSPSTGAYIPPTYAEGMLFVPLNNGMVQALNAKTLESLWIYTDASGGQALSPITYEDGCIYTSFWYSETRAANFVAIDVADEDTSKKDEKKVSLWTKSHLGGFYWAGAAVIGDYVIVGSDNGDGTATSEGTLYVFNKTTGAVVSTSKAIGDIRSSIAYDAKTGNVYFVTKPGYLYKAKINKTTGVISGLTGKSYSEIGTQATSTPVVYDGIVYCAFGGGVGGSGNFAAIDAETMELKGSIATKGYTQGSFLLSTAYEESGHLYFYVTYNKKPGGIQMVDVDKTRGTISLKISDIYEAVGFENFCIGSVICDNEGTLYYKNDSGNILAVQNEDAITALIKDVEATKINQLKATREGDNITLTWNRDGKAGTMHYEVMRSIVKAKNYQVLGTSSEASYTDVVDSKTSYTYKIRGVKNIDGKDYYSEEATITVKAIDTEISGTGTTPENKIDNNLGSTSNKTQVNDNNTTDEKGQNPTTGDTQNLMSWLFVLLLAGVALYSGTLLKKKNK